MTDYAREQDHTSPVFLIGYPSGQGGRILLLPQDKILFAYNLFYWPRSLECLN